MILVSPRTTISDPRSQRRLRVLLARVLGSVAVASAVGEGTARADGGYVSYGGLAGGVVASGSDASGGSLGVELSWAHYPRKCCFEDGYGAFAQYQRIFGDGRSDRYAFGYQSPGPIGFEFGLGVRQGEAGTSPQLHLAPFASIGLAHIALRLSPASGPYGSEAGLFVAFKLPVPYGSPPPSLNFGHGRPLVVGDRARVASLRVERESGWSDA